MSGYSRITLPRLREAVRYAQAEFRASAPTARAEMTPGGQGRPPGEFSDETGNDVRTDRVSSGVPLQPKTLSAFERYVFPEIQVLFRVARSLTRNDADAEDLVQDTLIRAHRSVDASDGKHPRAWLWTILRNTHINGNRRRRPELLRNPEQDLGRRLLAASSERTDHFINASFDAAVVDALASLDEPFRRVARVGSTRGFSVDRVRLAGFAGLSD